MALAPDVASSTDPHPIEAEDNGIHAPGLNYFVFGLFFIFGGITSLNDVLIPKLKELFTLNYTQAMLVQFCFFTAYLVIGIPGAKLVKRLGYMRGAVAGLLTMMVGCLMFIPASQNATYWVFLLALFVLASGVVIVQVVANPLISLLGPQRTAHIRCSWLPPLAEPSAFSRGVSHPRERYPANASRNSRVAAARSPRPFGNLVGLSLRRADLCREWRQ